MAHFCGTVGVLTRRSFGLLLLSCYLIPTVAQDSEESLSVPEDTIEKLLIHRVKPVLPAEPGMPIEGTVVLDAIVNKAGRIESLQMMSGHPLLVPAALAAVKQWRYRPYEVNGIPRAVKATIRVEFSNESEDGSETSALQAESPVLLTWEDMRERLVYRVTPIYPPLARQARIQGTVLLRIIINKLGEVRDVELVSGHPMLAPAAVAAVRKWRYMPYETEGKAVEVESEVQVIFRLAGG